MDKTILVAADFTTGLKLLESLDRANLSISVALWAHIEEYEEWRFVLASPRLDEVKRTAAYGLVHDAFDKAGISIRQTPALLIMRMSDPFIRSLRQPYAKSKDVEGIRLGGQLIGDRFVEDALVYRIR